MSIFTEDAELETAYLNHIEDIIVNHYSEENEPFSKKELRQILDSIVEVLDERTREKKEERRARKDMDKAVLEELKR